MPVLVNPGIGGVSGLGFDTGVGIAEAFPVAEVAVADAVEAAEVASGLMGPGTLGM